MKPLGLRHSSGKFTLITFSTSRGCMLFMIRATRSSSLFLLTKSSTSLRSLRSFLSKSSPPPPPDRDRDRDRDFDFDFER
eukprot:CAMPEP_0195134756 /NCGR_PEP_ID=MMETSP0448-20130528/151216_1 /TAXON_ID=66468 /ORGANISM="Heterocapsa triquestra, Strain CCMP 448" /LENGTH=79 /DNA_ID=CAMNT_0040172859 /DNA_START=181 /DNA_END=417 /DNA_ORIENTATION=+